MRRVPWLGLCFFWCCAAWSFSGDDLAQCERLANVKEWKGTYTISGIQAGSGSYTEADGGHATDAWNYAASFSAQMIIPNFLAAEICAIADVDLPLLANYLEVSATATFHTEGTYPADNGTEEIVNHSADWVAGTTPTLDLAGVAEVTFFFTDNKIEITPPAVGSLPATRTRLSTHFPTTVEPDPLPLDRVLSGPADNIVITMPTASASSLALIGSRPLTTGASIVCGLFAYADGCSGGHWTETWALYPTFQDGTSEEPPPKPVEDPCLAAGSIIGCENQSLGEVVAVAGTPYSLHYQSDRVPGNLSATEVAANYAKDLGGWTLNVVHRYDPVTNTLFLGDGAFRSAASLGTVTPATAGLLIAAQDGRRVYEFDADGVHTLTRHALTGAILLSVSRNAAGRLLAVTDGDGNVTSFTRNAAGNLTAIIGP